MTSLMNTPPLIRNIAVVGQFHHGKTLFVDSLVMATHTEEWDPSKVIRYSDTRKDEQERELSIKSTPVSLVLENIKGKSYLLNVLDCPGHINFCDEVRVFWWLKSNHFQCVINFIALFFILQSTTALRAADGVVILVDAAEGVMMFTERLIRQALEAELPICLVSIFFSIFNRKFWIWLQLIHAVLCSAGDQQDGSVDPGVEAASTRCVLQDTAYSWRSEQHHLFLAQSKVQQAEASAH